MHTYVACGTLALEGRYFGILHLHFRNRLHADIDLCQLCQSVDACLEIFFLTSNHVLEVLCERHVLDGRDEDAFGRLLGIGRHGIRTLEEVTEQSAFEEHGLNGLPVHLLDILLAEIDKLLLGVCFDLNA